jgi:hypothetical protein
MFALKTSSGMPPASVKVVVSAAAPLGISLANCNNTAVDIHFNKCDLIEHTRMHTRTHTHTHVHAHFNELT